MASDITEIVERYRLTLRNIWNQGIWVDPDLRSWESVDNFHQLKVPLFRVLVAFPLGLETDKVFGDQFHVVPAKTVRNGIPALQVNRDLPTSPGGGVWSVLLGPFKSEDISLVLLDFFDWTPMSYIDLRFYLVHVGACRDHPEIVGHHALVDVTHARVLWMPKEEQDGVVEQG